MTTTDLRTVCPRCGVAPREGLTHSSMLNSEPGVHHPYICIECSLIELEEMRKRGRVLPFSRWAMNDGHALGARDPRRLPRVLP